MTHLGNRASNDGDFIRLHRVSAGLSLRAVADAVGKSHTWLRNVEDGQPVPLEVIGTILIAIGDLYAEKQEGAA